MPKIPLIQSDQAKKLILKGVIMFTAYFKSSGSSHTVAWKLK